MGHPIAQPSPATAGHASRLWPPRRRKEADPRPGAPPNGYCPCHRVQGRWHPGLPVGLRLADMARHGPAASPPTTAATPTPRRRGHCTSGQRPAWWVDQKPNRSSVGTQVTSRLGTGPPPPDAHATTTATTSCSWMPRPPRPTTTGPTPEPPAYYVASSLWQLACCPDKEKLFPLAVLFGRPACRSASTSSSVTTP